MRKLVQCLFVGFAAVAFTVALGACSRSSEEQQSTPQNDEVRLAHAHQEIQKREQAAADRRRVEDETRANIRAQLRETDIARIRDVFTETNENYYASDTPWKDGVRGLDRPPIFDKICHGLDRFDDMERAYRTMSHADEPITWEELNIEAGDAGSMYWKTGIETAKLLIKMLEIPRGDRKMVRPCSEGKGSWNFAEEEVVGNRIIEILDAIHAGASDVGMTSGELRQLLITELTNHINELREAEEAGTR